MRYKPLVSQVKNPFLQIAEHYASGRIAVRQIEKLPVLETRVGCRHRVALSYDVDGRHVLESGASEGSGVPPVVAALDHVVSHGLADRYATDATDGQHFVLWIKQEVSVSDI